MTRSSGFRKAIAIILLCSSFTVCTAQHLLNKSVSLEVSRQRLDNVLEILSNKGNFFFSYNSAIIRKDSLVSISVSDKPVREILTALFGNGYEFRESGNYIILRRAPIRLRLVTSSAVSEDKYYTISGYVIDDQTGEKISDASIYEKERLVISNTNEQGFFKIRLRSRYQSAAITVSKEYYEDTTVIIQPKYNQSLSITLVPSDITEHTITISPVSYNAPETIELEIPINDSARWLYTYVKRDSVIVEKTNIGKWLVSSRQKIQSINLKKFFTVRPYQVSVLPGIGTNGRLNSQVINNFSFNVFGGYSGGVNGFELGGLFNIDKKDVRYVQIGGLFNVVGGRMNGLQIGGISNTVLNDVSAVQIGGINNFVKTTFSGVQIGGIYNHVGSTVDGTQVAGIVNFTKEKTRGAQVAGIANVSMKEIKGTQVAGIINYTKHLKGVQIGLINVSDTSEGYSIGLINIVFKGYHKLSFSTNEVMNLNASFKTGNAKLYSIFLGGYNAVPDQKIWSYGYGIGSEFGLGKKKKLAINAELTSQYLHLGSWDFLNLQNKATAYLNVKIGKYFSVFAGPTYSVYVSNQDVTIPGYRNPVPPSGYKAHQFGNTVSGWVGWTAGINLF